MVFHVVVSFMSVPHGTLVDTIMAGYSGRAFYSFENGQEVYLPQALRLFPSSLKRSSNFIGNTKKTTIIWRQL